MSEPYPGRRGIPKDRVIEYGATVKADDFLVVAHGLAGEVACAKAILGTEHPSRVNVHAGATAVVVPGDLLVPTAG